MILSFHPCFIGHRNIICAGRDPNEEDLAAIRKASAIVLPQGCRESLYQMAKDRCPHVFPNYDARFAYPGKLKQIELFSTVQAPYPDTRTFLNTEVFFSNAQPVAGFAFPFVFKFDWGGEGDFVFLVENEADLHRILAKAKAYEKTGQQGFLIQQYVPSANRSLRVVVIHQTVVSYWRIQENNKFYSNLSKGAKIDHDSDPDLQDMGAEVVTAFCKETKINLAGFDLLFYEREGEYQPLLIEINYFFGRTGLGGSEAYYQLLEREIAAWIAALKV